MVNRSQQTKITSLETRSLFNRKSIEIFESSKNLGTQNSLKSRIYSLSSGFFFLTDVPVPCRLEQHEHVANVGAREHDVVTTVKIHEGSVTKLTEGARSLLVEKVAEALC